MQQTVWKEPLIDSKSFASNLGVSAVLPALASDSYRLAASFACKHNFAISFMLAF